jgi:hypothetical protein
MLASDLQEEVRQAVGDCNDAKLFRYMTDAQKLLNNKGLYDALLGEIDICSYSGFVTLPAEVATVLSVNVCGQPTIMRDQWFQYHTNGPGTSGQPVGYSEELGRYCTYRDPSVSVKLVAQVEHASDTNKKLKVYGWYQGKRIYTNGPSGTLEDGFYVPMVYGYEVANPDVQAIDRIERIEKDPTIGYVKLVALDIADNTVNTTIGYYQPRETHPIYRRLHVADQSWVRVKYRKTDWEVRSWSDWINCDNREAFLLGVKAVTYRRMNDFAKAQAAESEMVRLMNDAHTAERPPGTLRGPRITTLTHPYSPSEGLVY